MYSTWLESKAYKLYDPKNKKVVISRDVEFEETQGWDWNGNEKTQSSSTLIDDNVIEFTTDEPVNQNEPEMSGIDDTNGNDTSDHEIDASDHEEEIDVESPDEVELSP